jgi:methionyl-tRNA formyltransferase
LTQSMRILFMGTGSFAVPSLKALTESDHQVIGVVTQPDRPAGRGRQIRISPVKELALAAGIPVYQPERVRSDDFVALVQEMSPDAVVVAAFGQIIPQVVLDIPRFGSVNVHGSLLPKYRGAAPVHYALFNGETRTGVTTMLMNAGLDTGPILLSRETEIRPEEDEAALEARLADIGAGLLVETLRGLEEDAIVPQPQDDSQATYAPSVKREECEVCWSNDALEIVNRIRGCTPRPGAYTFWQKAPLKVWSARALSGTDAHGSAGTILAVSSDGILVQAGRGMVLLSEVQPQNARRIGAAEFARGYRVRAGDALGGSASD